MVLQLPGYLRGARLAVVVFFAGFAFLLSGIHVEKGNDRPAFFIDEAHKIGESYFGHLFLGRLDVSNPLWTTDFYARTNPTVPKYVFWAGLTLSGHVVTDLKLQEEFERNWRRGDVLREEVPDGALRATRTVSALFGALAAACLFYAAQRLGGPIAGLVAVVLFLGHPDVAYHGRVGLPDSMLWFFMILALPVSWRAVAAYRRFLVSNAGAAGAKGLLVFLAFAALVPGVVVGLATGTKVNGALAGLAYAGTMAVAASTARPGEAEGLRRWVPAALAVLAAAAVSLVLFVAINPSYYHQPFGRIRETLRLYADWTVKQQVEPGGGLLDPMERISTVGVYTLRGPRSPLAALIGEPGSWLSSLGFLFGILFLARNAASFRKAGLEPGRVDRPTDAAATLVWTACCIVGLTLWLPLAWVRYLLLPYLAVCLLTGIGLAAGIPSVLSALAAARVARNASRLRAQRKDRPKTAPLSAGEPGTSPRALALALALTGAAWAVLAFTPWIIRPDLVPPGSGLTSRPPGGETRRPEELAEVAGRSTAACGNLGLSLVQAGRSREALPFLERALELAERGERNVTNREIRTAHIARALAVARGAEGDRAGVLSALRRHRAAVAAVRDAMVSGDPKIRQEYDGILAKDDRMIERVENPSRDG